MTMVGPSGNAVSVRERGHNRWALAFENIDDAAAGLPLGGYTGGRPFPTPDSGQHHCATRDVRRTLHHPPGNKGCLTMIAAYLYLNSVLYALFALWCTLQWKGTAANLGYLSLDNSGRSEYLVIYGGLQWGLAGCFLFFATDPQLLAAGLRFALAIYIPIVAYRLITIWRFRPVRKITTMVGVLEAVLLALGIGLYSGI
jgi:hypothetical protein